jgi:hypothetical protein
MITKMKFQIIKNNMEKYDLYLICDITNPDISLWVYETEIVIIPEEIQITFEIIYGCRSKIGC